MHPVKGPCSRGGRSSHAQLTNQIPDNRFCPAPFGLAGRDRSSDQIDDHVDARGNQFLNSGASRIRVVRMRVVDRSDLVLLPDPKAAQCRPLVSAKVFGYCCSGKERTFCELSLAVIFRGFVYFIGVVVQLEGLLYVV